MSSGGPSFHPERSNAAFATARWSVVLSAGDRSSPDAESALEMLCRTCWYPLYAFARRRGSSPDDSADLTQEFFSRLLEQEFLLAADREKGRVDVVGRSFLDNLDKPSGSTTSAESRN